MYTRERARTIAARIQTIITFDELDDEWWRHNPHILTG